MVRWLILASLVFAIYRAYKGYVGKSTFSKLDNRTRHWTATIAQIQLAIGMILATQSPVVYYFWTNIGDAVTNLDTFFFGLIHMLLMLTAIGVIAIGSSLAKREEADNEKYKTMLVWFSIALAIILIAIPWPFSPLANRPYFR